MFKKIGGCHAVNTSGFEVKFQGRDDLVYIETLPSDRSRKVTVYAEMLVGGRVNVSIEAGAKWLNCWDPPNNTTEISECERQRIVKNITDALDFLGIKYDLRQ